MGANQSMSFERVELTCPLTRRDLRRRSGQDDPNPSWVSSMRCAGRLTQHRGMNSPRTADPGNNKKKQETQGRRTRGARQQGQQGQPPRRLLAWSVSWALRVTLPMMTPTGTVMPQTRMVGYQRPQSPRTRVQNPSGLHLPRRTRGSSPWDTRFGGGGQVG